MFHTFNYRRLAWLGIGLVSGLILGGIWPESPLHAVATDRYDTFAMATGPVDEDIEAVFFLDFLTGDLQARVLNKQAGKFTAFFGANVLEALALDPSKNPRYLMVTGIANLRRGGVRLQPSRSVVYVAEITTGNVAAYAIPWDRAMHNMGRMVNKPMVLLDVTRFRAGAGLGTPPGP
jgi:hypothetical protein